MNWFSPFPKYNEQSTLEIDTQMCTMIAIGDKAAEIGISAFREAGVSEKDRAILTHCQVLRKDLVMQMKELGEMIWKMQSSSMISLMLMLPSPQESLPMFNLSL